MRTHLEKKPYKHIGEARCCGRGGLKTTQNIGNVDCKLCTKIIEAEMRHERIRQRPDTSKYRGPVPNDRLIAPEIFMDPRLG